MPTKPCRLLLLIFFASLYNGVIAQLKLPVDSATGRISYTEIVYVDSATKSQLFSKSLEWIAVNYKSANAVIELKDEAAGKIIVKGNFSELMPGAFASLNVIVWHMLNITCKDGRCKVQLTGWNYKYCLDGMNCTEETFEKKIADISNGGAGKKAWIAFFESCDKRAHNLLDSYSDFLQKPQPKEDW